MEAGIEKFLEEDLYEEINVESVLTKIDEYVEALALDVTDFLRKHGVDAPIKVMKNSSDSWNLLGEVALDEKVGDALYGMVDRQVQTWNTGLVSEVDMSDKAYGGRQEGFVIYISFDLAG